MASTAKTTTHVPSTRALFYALDQKTTSREKVLEKLDAATPFLQQGLKAYGPNSAASKAALESGSIDVGGKTIAVGADMQKCTVMLAQLLKLDEIQTYVMLRRALEEKGITARPKEVTGELIELVCTFYHRERLALLKCVAVLGTQKAYVFDGENDDGFGGNEKEGEEAEFASRLSEKLEEMIKNGLEDNIVNYLCDSLLANGEGLGLLAIGSSREERSTALAVKNPTSTALATGVSNEGEKQASTLIRTQGEEFIRLSSCLESVEEIKASLDVLFSLYYGVVKECSSTRFLQLAKTFDQKVFSKIPHKCTEVINLAPSMAEQMETAVTFDIRARCAIILIVAVDLERIVHTFTSGQGSGEAQHHLLSSVVQVTTVLSQTTDTVESGAVKLAWAAFLSLAKSMITGISQADEQAMTAFLSASDVASGLDSLKNIAMNTKSSFDGSDPSAVPRRSVLKNVFSATLAGFDILPVHGLLPTQLDLILECFDEIICGQRELCEQFWEGASENGQEAPLLALVEGCRERFPAESAPLLRILKSLSEGPKAAECALSYLTKLPAVALPYPDREVAEVAIKQASTKSRVDRSTGNIFGNVVCSAPISSSKVPGACIPSNCRGVSIPSSSSSGTNLIVWSEPADGLYITLSRIGNLSSVARRRREHLTPEDRSELHAALSFIAVALENAPSFAAPLLRCDLHASASEIGGTPSDVLSALALSLRVEKFDDYSIQAMALAALRPLAAAAPRRAADIVLNTPFFTEDDKASSTNGVTVSQCLQFEESRGVHDSIKALCALSETLLLAGECGDESQLLFQRSALYAMLRFDSWRYLERSEKWIVHKYASQALQAALLTSKFEYFERMCMIDDDINLKNGMERSSRSPKQTFSIRTCVFLMNDEQTLAGAFAPLRFDAQFLQRAYESGSECRSKEIVALEDAIASVLRVIPALSSVFEHNSEITGGTFSRSIAKALFIQAPPPERGPPMVQAIASYASYPYASECCTLAIPALIPLCTTAPASAPLSAAFGGVQADETCRQLRDRIKLALKEFDIDPESTSHVITLLASASANQPPFADAIIYGPDYAQLMLTIRDGASGEDDGVEKDDGTKSTEDGKGNNANALAEKQPSIAALITRAILKSSEPQYPTYDELWLALDKILDIEDVSYGATFAFALNIFWKSRVALPNPVDGLASEPRVFQKLASIVERANEVCSQASNHDDVVHANAFSALSSSLGILASESLVALTVPVNRSEHLREAVHHFVSRDEGLLRSIKLSLSSVEDKTNVAWMKMDIFILGLRAVMLSAAAELATAQAGGDSVCFASATLEAGAELLARSLLEQPVAREVLSREGQKAAARLLTDVAHAATATFETVFADNDAFVRDIRHASSRVNDLLHHATTSNCENFIFVDAPIGLSGGSVYGDSYVYDSEWIERACGVFNTDDGRWGAPETRLASLARKVAACSREVSLVVSLCDAKISAIESLSAFLKASGSLETFQNIVGPELDALDAEQLKALEERKEHVKKKLLAPLSNVGISALGSRNDGGKVRTSDGENDNNEQNGCGFSLVQPSILKKWSHHSRRDTVNTIALELIHAVQNRRSESPRQVSLIVALCELLEISARLWSCSRKNYSANRSDGANEDYEALQNVARAACAFLSSKICPISHIACAHSCAAFERSLSCWSKEANSEDAARAIDIGNVASQAIPQIRDLAVSNAVPAASSVCALRLLTKLFGNGGAFASPSMLVLGSDDFSSSMFIPDISSAFTSVDSNNNSLASLRVAITSGEQIQVDCDPSKFDELARLTSSDVVFSALYACLELAKTPEGAYVLAQTGAYDRVCELVAKLLNEYTPMADESFEELDVLKLATLNLSIQISTELARSLRNSDIDSSVTSKLASFACLVERYILSAMKPTSITLSNLRKAKVCCALLSSISSDERLKFGWQVQSPNGQANLRDEAALFLRWFAAPPVHSGATSHNCCLPQNAAEEARTLKPSEAGLSSCWFGVLNRGSRVLTSLRTQSSALSPMALSPAANGASPLMLGLTPSTTPLGTKNSVLFTSSTPTNGNTTNVSKTPSTPTLISNQGGQALGTPLGRKRFNDAKSPKTPDGGILKSPSPIHSLNAGTASERTNLHSEILAAELHDIAMHCSRFLSSFQEKNVAPDVASAIVDQCDVLLEELNVNKTNKTKAGTRIEESLVGIKRSILKSA